jgi:hypothetical protein
VFIEFHCDIVIKIGLWFSETQSFLQGKVVRYLDLVNGSIVIILNLPIEGRIMAIGRPLASSLITSSARFFVNEYVFGQSPITLRTAVSYNERIH